MQSLMWRLAAVLLVVSCLSVQGRNQLEDTPAEAESCADRKGCLTPSYKVLNKTDGLEIRKYQAATWAVAFGRSRWLADLAVLQAGRGLAGYFGGNNVNHTKIPRTFPLVATAIRPPPPPPPPGNHSDNPPAGHHNHTHHPPHPPGPPAIALAAFIPKRIKGEAPLPDNPHVKIRHTNATKVYVHSFGGWAFSWTIKREIKHLKMELKQEKICPRKGRFFAVFYDGPWKIFHRKNEVWWVKKPHHNNETDVVEGPQITESPSIGFEAFGLPSLFPEEFPDLNENMVVTKGLPKPSFANDFGQAKKEAKVAPTA